MQKTTNFVHLTELARKYDILFIQEFVPPEEGIAGIQQIANHNHYHFITGPRDEESENKTGIFINLHKFKIEGENELSVARLVKHRTSDIRVTTQQGGHYIFQNLYLLPYHRSDQLSVLNETIDVWEQVKSLFPEIELVFGGDFNNVVERVPPTERQTHMAIKTLTTVSSTEDVACYSSNISNITTNRGISNRRIDRIYAPKSWRHRALQFETFIPLFINSTHVLISIYYSDKDDASGVQIGKPRFRFPLNRLFPPFHADPGPPMPRGTCIDDAIHIIKSDGIGYIRLMGAIRKRDPVFAHHILHDHSSHSEGDVLDNASKRFFQPKKIDNTIFKRLTDESRERTASTVPEMLELAKTFYEDLYLKPTHAHPDATEYLMRGIKRQLKRDQRRQLNRKFSTDELFEALKQSEKSSAPGADGLQYPVLEFYWELFGPILKKAANDMMTTGELPRCLQEVLITLIPKRDKADSYDIADLRPILLSNTALKVISTATCTRLQEVINDLIGPYQRGFMRDRQIDHNTMEFFAMIDLIRKSKTHEYAAILMIDFMKAFDRISHHYLGKVFRKMKLGKRMINLLELILHGQFARIHINNFASGKIALNCGTRQGNPLSPLIFNLALEPFLIMVAKQIRGIPLWYENIQIESMKYHAFADDVNIYLRNRGDYMNMKNLIDKYEKASNSIVSFKKSRLIGFDEDYTLLSQPWLNYHAESITSVDMKYLGITMKGVDWKAFRDNLPFTTYSQGFYHFDLITRAIGMNRFVSSKTVYRDLVQCMKGREIKDLDKAIHKQFRGIGIEKTYARPKKGGYGLIKLEFQLLGHRAKVILQACLSTRWYDTLLRLKMLHHMVKIDKDNKDTPLSETMTLEVGDFLLQESEKYVQNLEWTFTENEIEYIWAWRHLVETKRHTTHEVRTFEKQEILDQAKKPVELEEDEQDEVKHAAFRSISKRIQDSLPPIMPRRFTEICPSAKVLKRWDVFWKKLYAHEWLQRHDFTAFHLFNFGSYVPCHDNERDPEPMECLLCVEEVMSDKILGHLYNDCEVSKSWWHRLDFLRPMSLEEMLTPADTSYLNLKRLNHFVKTVRRTYLMRNNFGLNDQLQYPTVRELDRYLAAVDPKGR